MFVTRRLVGQRSWNRKFHLSARTRLAPEIQVRADSLCALAHAGNPKVSRLSAGLQYLGIDALAVVTHSQTKLILIVPDLYFDVAGSGMSECISDHLARDTVDLVLEHWRHVSLLAFHQDAIGWGLPIQFASRCQFTADSIQQLRKAALCSGFRTQVTNRRTAFLNRFLGSNNCFIQDRRRIVGFPQQQFTRGLKLKCDPLKTLKQGVVQLAGDACSFRNALFKTDIELTFELKQPQPVEQQCQTYSEHDEHGTQPRGLPDCRLNINCDRTFRAVP